MINKSKIIKDAQKFVAKGQWDKAIVEYDKVLKETPGDANTHNTVGDLYLKRNEKDNAIESFKKAAEILNKDGFTLKAIALYKKVLNINPDRVDIMMLMGKLNAERGMLGSANEHYLAAAAYFSKHGQKVKAIDIYKTLCDLNPENLALTQKLAELYLSEGFEKEGLSKFIELAEKKINSGELRDAHEFLAKIKTKSSDRFEFIRVSAMLDLKENRLPESIKKLETARSHDPGDERVAALLAEALHRSGRYEEAGGIYQELLQKDPNNDFRRKQHIDVCVKSGDYSAAWKEYSVLVENCMSRNEVHEAEGLVKEFLKLRRDDIEARQLLVNIYTKAGRGAEVSALHREIADIYFNSGDFVKADNVYKQLLKHDPENEEVKARIHEIAQGAPAAKAPGTVPVNEAPPAENIKLPPVEEKVEEAAGVPNETASTYSLDEGTKPGGLPEMEEGLPGEGLYELPEAPGGLPQIGTGDEPASGGRPETGGKVFELPDAETGVLEDLDVFDTAAGAPAPPETRGEEIGVEAPESPVEEEPAGLEELLTEIDVYIKYGLFNKAEETMITIEETFPASPEISRKKIDLCKAQGDVDGFVKLSLELSELLTGRGMFKEAEDAVQDALAMDPSNALLVSRLEKLSATSIPEEEAPALGHAGLLETPAPVGPDHGLQAGSVHYLEDLAEADFYAQQGLVDEARAIYKRLLAGNPDDAGLKAKSEALVSAGAARPEAELVPPASLDKDLDEAFEELDIGGEEEASAKPPVMAAPAPPAHSEEEEFFDLAAELQEEMEEEIIKPESSAEAFEDKHLEEVFHEFKKGVEEQLGKEDYETHYNLGIAYKEMGMLDEAISEFTLASRDQTRSLDCASMLGLCYMEKAEYIKALSLFRKGLEIKGRDKEEYMGLKYDMATAFERSGDLASACALVKEIADEDPRFRDVKERLKALQGAVPATAPKPESSKADKPAGPGKKSKVSYL